VSKVFWGSLLLICATVYCRNAVVADETKTVLRVESSVVRLVALDRNNRPIGLGSGFAVDREGHLATNHHVVEGAARVLVAVKNTDGKPRFIDGRVVWSSVEVDLAFVRIAAGTIPELTIAGVSPRKAERVFALGYPADADIFRRGGVRSPQFVESTATNGSIGRIVSGSFVRSGPAVEIIQHSAPINSGNSGGPLFDRCGRVIGVNTGKAISTLDNDQVDVITGIHFASSSRVLLAAAESAQIRLVSESAECSDLKSESGVGSESFLRLSGAQTLGALGAFILAVFVIVSLSRRLRLGGSLGISSAIETKSFPVDTPPNRTSTRETDYLSLQGSDSLGSPVWISLASLTDGVSELYVGRSDQESQLVLADSTVSRRHLKIYKSSGALWVCDCGSKNGTFINRREVKTTPTLLQVGDEIRLGSVVLRVRRASS